MFEGIISPTRDEVNEAIRAQTALILALYIALDQKGIISGDEIMAMHPKAMHVVEQEFARKRDERLKEFDEQYPGMRALFEKLGDI